MKLQVEPYPVQPERLPRSGRHILAQFDDEAIVVYQAFLAGLADASEHLWGLCPACRRKAATQAVSAAQPRQRSRTLGLAAQLLGAEALLTERRFVQLCGVRLGLREGCQYAGG